MDGVIPDRVVIRIKGDGGPLFERDPKTGDLRVRPALAPQLNAAFAGEVRRGSAFPAAAQITL